MQWTKVFLQHERRGEQTNKSSNNIPEKRKNALKSMVIDNKENPIKMMCVDSIVKHNDANHIDKPKQNL